VLQSVLLVLLAAAISLAAALSAFIVARAFGKPAFRALCYSAATFTAALTLAFLALSFVENAVQDHNVRSHSSYFTGSPLTVTGSIMRPQYSYRLSGDLYVHSRVCTTASALP
jgi:hypothetical protein